MKTQVAGPISASKPAIMDDSGHVPVLYDEVLHYLQPQPNGRYIDGTLGAGGHTAGLLEQSAPDGQVLAFDRDAEAVAFAQKRLEKFGNRVHFVHASYVEMEHLAPQHGFSAVDGILLDLGLSSRQLEAANRGFSFMKEGPLDMRFDQTQSVTAADLVNNLEVAELANLFWRYGDERKSRHIARVIADNRPIETTTQLADLIASHVRRRGRIHPATRVFQALRIAVNDELAAVEAGVETAVTLLKPGGRLAVISFHSLEDRFVKHYFRQLAEMPSPPTAASRHKLVKRKAIKASDDEMRANPRSRSARLRVIEKIGVH